MRLRPRLGHIALTRIGVALMRGSVRGGGDHHPGRVSTAGRSRLTALGHGY